MEAVIAGLIAGFGLSISWTLNTMLERKVVEYRIMKSKTLRELGQTVNQCLEMGYQPIGGVIEIQEEFHQPMVKYN